MPQQQQQQGQQGQQQGPSVSLLPRDKHKYNAADNAVQFLRTAVQSIGVFLLIQFLIRQLTSGYFSQDSSNKGAGAAASMPDFDSRPALNQLKGQYSAIPRTIAPIWPSNTSLDISLYVSPSLVMPSLHHVPSESLVLNEKNVVFGDWSESRDIQTSFAVPPEVKNNGTLWAHIYVSQSGSISDPTAGHYDPSLAYHFVRPLNQFIHKKRTRKTRNLLASADDEEDEKDVGLPDSYTASYYHPNFTLSLIPDAGVQSYMQMHPAAREWVQLESTGARDSSGQNGWYYPVLYLNTFWQLRSHMTELNSTVQRLPLNIHLNSLAHWKFALIASLDFGMKENAKKVAAGEKLPGGGDGSEMEEVKRILIDSNIYLLSTTAVVGVLHTIFEMLAFKSDVSHWRNKKDNVGVSFRTILANVFMQIVIFLYLMDNNENTSWMILLGQGMGILLEAWKITKTVDVRVRPTPADSTAFPWRFLPYTVVFEDKHKLSETERKTQEYDEIAFKYLYYVAIPLLLAYAAYSLAYEQHKSWYSFVIATLVGSVYAYGFLMMVPSLYINYRLKSVAHMPGRALMYKTLNTFIDDLFAFTVKMPILHRLATFRDDIIFFVYLYQSYAYKVDHTRVNEFGQGGDDEDEASAEKAKAIELLEKDASKKDAATKAVATGKESTPAKKRK